MWCRFFLFLHLAFLIFGLPATLSDGYTTTSTIPPHRNSQAINLDADSRARSLSRSQNRSKTPTVEYHTKDTRNNNYCEPYLSSVKPMDCEELLQMGYTKSGIYVIWPRNKIMNDRWLEVYCDMETDRGGWTLLQKRGNFLRATDYFFKEWNSYKVGFGDIEEDFWLGNDNIFALTNQKLYSVRFDLQDVEGEHRYASYDIFFIENEESKYKLTIQDYKGTANDSMIAWHNGQKFSTKDQDNDNNEKGNCAQSFKGGWWYNNCHAANLNGLYLRGKHESFADGVVWLKWKGYHESMDTTEIKIRPKNFHKTNV